MVIDHSSPREQVLCSWFHAATQLSQRVPRFSTLAFGAAEYFSKQSICIPYTTMIDISIDLILRGHSDHEVHAVCIWSRWDLAAVLSNNSSQIRLRRLYISMIDDGLHNHFAHQLMPPEFMLCVQTLATQLSGVQINIYVNLGDG